MNLDYLSEKLINDINSKCDSIINDEFNNRIKNISKDIFELLNIKIDEKVNNNKSYNKKLKNNIIKKINRNKL